MLYSAWGMRTALVLSGGGMFGAYQAGVWSALEGKWRPDIVVGTSVGALNGWAIAGGASGNDLIALWRDAGFSARLRWRVPRTPWGGLLDSHNLNETIRKLHATYQPRTEIGITVTALPRPRAQLVRNGDITWHHLAASCAVLGMLAPLRIDNRSYCDGGMLGALPLWASAEMGATRIVAIPVMPRMPFAIRALLGAARAASARQPDFANIETIRIEPAGQLGGAPDLLAYDRDKIERWIEMGRRDADQVLRQIIS